MHGRADGNGLEARQLNQERFPGRRLPNVTVFYNTYRRLYETGSVTSNGPGVNPGRYPPEAEDLILQAFEDDPTTSTRKVAAYKDLKMVILFSEANFDVFSYIFILRMNGSWKAFYLRMNQFFKGGHYKFSQFASMG
ncbi:unnamed protein product [Acanthoscelides obtectus]|uniref:Uncharacterized protein n=1 Tax=Acanthoscelides obtectus TaxID=200917 RepID=A0A9P0JLZ2_ACAOB|nr:unnamed protein product [Acanthoscelides obtectus]CAK1642780.1 hypothetical protein AOBTE_LOCUS13209 [Acanthoscelides obtectus]